MTKRMILSVMALTLIAGLGMTDRPALKDGDQGFEGTSNTFYGLGAGLSNKTGLQNSFFGYKAGNANTSGPENTFVGYWAGVKNTTGGYNTFVGAWAGSANVSGIGNVFFGECAGLVNSSGRDNTFIGGRSGRTNTTGSSNTYLGNFSGINNVTGSRNVFIGYWAGYNEKGSDRLYIANSNTATPLIWGNFAAASLKFNGRVGIKTAAAPKHLLDVGTSGAYCDGGAWVAGSSREHKENIKELTSAEALRALEQLEPVKFSYKENNEETYLGFIAEDVPDLVAMNDRKGLSAMDMVAMLTKVVQEEMKVNQEQRKAISELQEKIARLEKRPRQRSQF